MRYRFIVEIDTSEDILIGDKERIAQALETVAGVRAIRFPKIELQQERIKDFKEDK